MLMALIALILQQFGIQASEEDLRRYEQQFRDRRHHISADFHSTRSDGDKQFTPGIAYEYLVDRERNGYSFEVQGQMLGKFLDASDKDWFLGGGVGWYPIRPVKLFAMAGPQWTDGDPVLAGRVGVGYRFMFFNVGIMPNLYYQHDNDDVGSLAIGARLQY